MADSISTAQAERPPVKYFTPKSIAALVFGCLIPLALTGTGMTAVMTNLPNVMEQSGLTPTGVAPAMMLVTLTAWATGLIGSRAINKLTPKYALMVGSITTGIYVLIEGTTDSVLVFTLAGILCGTGMGLGSIAASVAFSEQFFGEQSGRVSAVCICVMQVGGAALTAILATGLRFLDWHTVLMIYGIVCGVGGTLLELIFIHKPSEEVQRRVEELRLEKEAAAAVGAADGVMLKEGMKTPGFWFLVVAMLTGAIVLAAMGTYGTTFFTSFGLSVSDATYFASFGLLFAGINVLWTGAYLQQKVGPVKYVIIYNALIIAGLVCMFVWTAIPAVLALVFVAFFLRSFDQCTTNVPALLVPPLFGYRDFNGFQSTLTGFYFLGVFTSQATSAAVFEFFGPAMMIVYCGIMTVVSMVCFLVALSLGKKKQQASSEAATA